MQDNIVLEPIIAAPVHRLAAGPASPTMCVLAQVNEGGYQQRIVGQWGDLPAALAWLEEWDMKRQGWRWTELPPVMS